MGADIWFDSQKRMKYGNPKCDDYHSFYKGDKVKFKNSDRLWDFGEILYFEHLTYGDQDYSACVLTKKQEKIYVKIKDIFKLHNQDVDLFNKNIYPY